MQIQMRIDRKDRARLEKAMKQLPEKVFLRHAGKAAGKAMTPVSRTAKKMAPKESGDYRKSIGKKRKTYRRTHTVWVGVGPRKGKANAYLGHLHEFGHRIVVGGTTARVGGKRHGKADAAKDRSRTGKGRVVGFVPPRPHLRPGLRNNQDKVFSTCKTELKKGVLEEARKI